MARNPSRSSAKPVDKMVRVFVEEHMNGIVTHRVMTAFLIVTEADSG